MEYEWDYKKAAANLRKHGVDFADAVGVFEDGFAMTIADPRHREPRFVTAGMDALGHAVECYTNTACQPISAALALEAIGMIGTGAISYASCEAGAALASRRSIYARRRIPAGKTIDEDDLVALRPGVGFPAYMLKSIVGKRARVDIPGDFLIRSEHLSVDG